MKARKVVLMILDGWGIGNHTNSDAVHQAKTPCFDRLMTEQPNSTLITYGEDVGLPAGQMGNSEVGHMNIGAGRVVYQDLVKINRAIQDQSINSNPVLQEAFAHAKQHGKALHFMGLVSDGGVHSLQEHLHHLCSQATATGLEQVYVHAFTDGRDTDPTGGLGYLEKLEKHLDGCSAELVSVVGRYYAMDRDKRWERVKEAYDLLTAGKGTPVHDLLEGVKASYEAEITDEFIQPLVKVDASGQPRALIQEGDVVVCFNYRTDRCREITMALTQQDFPEHGMHTRPLHYVTMTRYDKSFQNVQVVFEKNNLEMTLGEAVAQAGLQQVRTAETEKYPHVTFFFSGMREEPFPGESRIMVNSPKVATYDLQPEMSAPEITEKISAALSAGDPHFVCLNFANPDMVGHTGDFDAVMKAVETVDGCMEQVLEAGQNSGYSFVIIADHGNADFMINADGSVNTAHSTNLVPCILVDDRFDALKDGILADVAPTILHMMGLPIPAEMTGKVLV